MLTKRIIPCLDVRDGMVVKGIQFKNHRVIGNPIDLASQYSSDNADELVFYDITASADNTTVKYKWINDIAAAINIPFCVAGGINNINIAENILASGADKISINTPAIENANLITELAKRFGSQCVVVGIDSFFNGSNYQVYAKTGKEESAYQTNLTTHAWVKEAQERGAGEIVLNCMNQDGVKKGYDIDQLSSIREICNVPLIASGGAGCMDDFLQVFNKSNVDGALAASVFHNKEFTVMELKKYLIRSIRVRI
ncbi:MAG: imidazole glycerol phosphate synthase subunit HisF [Pseudomonadota bacterium]|jgi:cyclase